MQYLIHQMGRDPYELEATSVSDAKRQLIYLVRQETKRCRQRFSEGHQHRVNSHSYLVTLGRDPRSSLWTSLSLQIVK